MQKLGFVFRWIVAVLIVICGALTFILPPLKILGLISISWLWVLSPLWGLMVIGTMAFLIGIAVFIVRDL